MRGAEVKSSALLIGGGGYKVKRQVRLAGAGTRQDWCVVAIIQVGLKGDNLFRWHRSSLRFDPLDEDSGDSVSGKSWPYEHRRALRRCRPKATRIGTHGFFILDAQCSGDLPMAPFRCSRVRSSRLAEALYLQNVKLLISERRE